MGRRPGRLPRFRSTSGGASRYLSAVEFLAVSNFGTVFRIALRSRPTALPSGAWLPFRRRRLLCPFIPPGPFAAAVLTASLLARIDPGATYFALAPLPGLLPAGLVGLPKRSHQSSPESSPCQKIFAIRAKNSTGFGGGVNLVRRTRSAPPEIPCIHPLYATYGRAAPARPAHLSGRETRMADCGP